MKKYYIEINKNCINKFPVLVITNRSTCKKRSKIQQEVGEYYSVCDPNLKTLQDNRNY